MIVAIGVDWKGYKHVLDLREGATENSVVVKDVLADLVELGVKPDRQRLFGIDGSKALRKEINEVFGREYPVQRRRKHNDQNVLGYLPEEQKERTQWVMRGSFKPDANKGMAKPEGHARWLDRSHPDAVASLRDGMEDLFTINRLGLPPTLRRCLETTNIIENPNSGMRQRRRNVKRWRDGKMVLRWLASAYLDIEKHFLRIMGYKNLWGLDAALNEGNKEKRNSRKKVA